MTSNVQKIEELLAQPFRDSDLTLKERQATRLAAFGYTNPEIAISLGISLPAVASRIYLARKKLKVSKPGLTRMVFEELERIVQS